MAEINPIKQEVIIVSGLQASGKTKWSKEWVAEDPHKRVRINYDDLRLSMFGPGWRFNYEDESKMKRNAHTIFEIALFDGKSVVIDNTNLTPRSRQKWIAAAEKYGAEVVMHEINPGISTCIERDRARESGRVGEAVISRAGLFNGFYDWRAILGDRMAVIFDVDGTLADVSKRRHYVDGVRRCSKCQKTSVQIFGFDAGDSSICPDCNNKLTIKKDWRSFFKECPNDAPIQPIVNLAKDFRSLGYEIIVVSGRGIDDAGIATEDWLIKHEVPYDHLFMRASKDHREDTIVKKEILDLLPKEKIAFVVDDRDSVVKMWRENGLTCLQAAPGDF